MKIFVTGAAGFVGASVVKQAAADGHQVVAAVRSHGKVERLDPSLALVELVSVDLREVDAVPRLLREHRPDAVVHTAWSGVDNISRHDRSQIINNLESSWRLVDAASAAGVRKFVGLGSQGEYGLISGKINEDQRALPTSLYGATKLAVLNLGRQIAAQSDMSFAWLRLFSTYGPHDNPNWLIPSLIEKMLDNERPRTSLGVQLWDYLYIERCGKRRFSSVEFQQRRRYIFNLGSGRPVAVRSIVEQIRDLVRPDLELVFGEIEYRPDQIWHMEADIRRLTELAGWSPRTDLKSGLEKDSRLAPVASRGNVCEVIAIVEEPTLLVWGTRSSSPRY